MMPNWMENILIGLLAAVFAIGGIAVWLAMIVVLTSPFWALGLVALHYVGWI